MPENILSYIKKSIDCFRSGEAYYEFAWEKKHFQVGKMTNVYFASLPRSASTLLGLVRGQHDKRFHIGESHYWKKLILFCRQA